MRYMLQDRKWKRRTAGAKGEASQGRYDADQNQNGGGRNTAGGGGGDTDQGDMEGKRVGGEGGNQRENT